MAKIIPPEAFALPQTDHLHSGADRMPSLRIAVEASEREPKVASRVDLDDDTVLEHFA